MKTDFKTLAELTDEDWRILERLQESVATTPDLAVRLRTMPERIQPTPERFIEMGLVETHQVPAIPLQINRIANKGRKVLASFSFNR